jgi:glutamine synthetase
MSAPTNVSWGYDNRTCGIRAPNSAANARRVENRVPGIDVNAYLVIAATLACGYQGIVQAMQPTEPLATSTWNMAHDLPHHLEDTIKLLHNCTPMHDLLGSKFIDGFCAVKELEYGTY